MSGLANPYLADIFAAFQPGAEAAGIAPPTEIAPPPPAPPAAPTVLQAAGLPSLDAFDLRKLGAPKPPEAAPTMIDGSDSSSVPGPAINAPGISPAIRQPTSIVRDTPPDVNGAPPPAPGATIEPDPHAFELQAAAGGGAPAHEQELRGPSLLAAQGHRNDTVEGAIGAVTERNQHAADEEYQMAVTQERSARLREAAYQQSVAEQEDELAARQSDFDATTKQMSRLGQVDQGRFWASRSTGQKLAGALEVMLAGFRGAPSAVMKRIDDDVKAQEFAYGAARDQANAKQTAFSAAMAKYQNVNAARAAAHVASIDVLQAQLSQTAAKNKGNETGNRAIMAIADLDNEKMLQIQQGIRFMPAVAGGRYWKDPATGLVYNDTEAKALRAKQVEYAQHDRTKVFDLGADIYKAHDKAETENAASGGIGKENAQKLALEERKATIERDALLNAIGLGQQNVKAIVKGGYSDDILSHQPAWAPGAESSRANVTQREAYNNTARLSVAAAYKLSTDATEPKNRALLEEYAAPYMIDAGDNEKSATGKMHLLRELVTKGAASKGVLPPGQSSTSSAMPSTFGDYAAGKK